MSDRKRTRDSNLDQPPPSSRPSSPDHASPEAGQGPFQTDDPFPEVAGDELDLEPAAGAGGSQALPSSIPASDLFLRMEDEDVESFREEGEGEDLIGDGMERDYRPHDILDHYESDGVDDAMIDDGGMDFTARRAAEARMAYRDAEERRLNGESRMPGAFMDLDEDEGDGLAAGEDPFTIRHRRRRQGKKGTKRGGFSGHLDIFGGGILDGQDGADGEQEEVRRFPVEALRDIKASSVAEWVSMAGPRAAIADEFRGFLQSYTIDGRSIYGGRIQRLGEDNGESLEVDYRHLLESKPIIASFLLEAPAQVLPILDTCAYEVILRMWSNYSSIHQAVRVRIAHLPVSVPLRELRRSHLNRLIRVSGVVTRRTGVFPQLRYVTFECGRCGDTIGPFHQDEHQELKIGACPRCEHRGPFSIVAEKTVYSNYQKLTLQESPGSVPPGRLPRHREVILTADLVDHAKPGEEVEVTGVYRNNYDATLNARQGFPVFATVIEANSVRTHRASEDIEGGGMDGAREEGDRGYLSEEDIRQIRSLSRDPRIFERIVQSIAPSIYGHDDIKTAIALALFGGVPKDVQGKHRLRGDINVLLLGDPGTAKSQFLKYAEKTAHRAVFTTGQGASAVGLTASVRKDPVTREWTLEGGALVLADRGVCCIDEFDKMNDADRTSIHEAMEQQSISVSKAGIVTSLQARCAVIAAANPIRGRYNASVPFGMNVELTEPILSRFDILCVVRDTVDAVGDELLAKFVVDSHVQSHPHGPLDGERKDVRMEPREGEEEEGAVSSQVTPVDQALLRKYIHYARERIYPKFGSTDQQDKVATLYADLRRESLTGGSIPITVRHVESMIRMAEARARMHLRERVRGDDLDVAIRVMLESFIGAQKHSVMRTLRRAFARYVEGPADHEELLLHHLRRLVHDQVRYFALTSRGNGTGLVDVTGSGTRVPDEVRIPLEMLRTRVAEGTARYVRPFTSSRVFRENGFTLEDAGQVIVKRMAGAVEGS
ncbi:MCM2/3/5 family-domain-containing protein [Piptocephalis cylindrospora]|uniref:DNA replication licensing factor MCM2 n=1 Tax=Piptocephalis cylindrospora TaxID=1907219 RepID=A0A4P9Y4C7_9FUNG|nr:MCM2/3/5 family-domain-containing protein [Piptocephalis cylindrospora]|eukprot:RKP13512.1 MCM2/3/5 family-domain-containing protein [Piptocephalis cylindrospora]